MSSRTVLLHAVLFTTLIGSISLSPRHVAAQSVSSATATVSPDLDDKRLLRMPVRGGSLTLKVADFVAARQRVIDATTSVGAEVTGGRTFVSEKGRKHGYVHLRLPTDRLPRLLPAIRAVGTLASDDLSTTEVISDYEDLGRRIERLRKHQNRLDELLHSRRNLRGSDILYVQERLFRAGVDEEQLIQARLDMERQSRTARLTVTLFEPPPVLQPLTPIAAARNSFGRWFDNGKRRAEWRRSQLMAGVATGAAFALVYAPIWLPLSIASILLLRVVWSQRVPILRAAYGVIRFGEVFLPSKRQSPTATTVQATPPPS